MRIYKILKYTGLLVFGYLLLLSLSYSVRNPAYQAIVTLLVGIFTWFGVNHIRVLHNKYGAMRVFLGILFLGGVVRFLWAILIPTVPFSDFKYFHDNALKLSQGSVVLTKNMGYSLLLSAGYRIYPGVLTGKLINATASTLSILFLYLVGSKLINHQAGLISSFLFALLPSEILMISVLGTEVTATTLGIITAFFIFRTINGKLNVSTKWIFWAGISYSFGLFVRSSFLFYFPAILIFLVMVTFSDYKKMAKAISAFVVGLAFGLIVVLTSYYLSTSRFSLELLKTHDSFPFLSGTNIKTSGRWGIDDANLYSSWESDKRDILAIREAINRIKSNPIGFMLLIPKKVNILFGDNTYGIYWSLRDIDWQIGKLLIGLFSQSIYVFILFFGLLAFKYSENSKLLLVTLILVLSTLLPHTVLEVQGRYHHYVMPFIVLLSSYGLQQFQKMG